MNITRLETTFFPNTPDGKKVADDFEAELKKRNWFRGRKEDTRNIIIKAEYTVVVKDGERNENQ